jgi:post-segregation antitoxin (ccd killing protein)
MPRLNITVPQDLYDRLEKWRDRLNLSRICQDALARELARLEEIPDEVAADA